MDGPVEVYFDEGAEPIPVTSLEELGPLLRQKHAECDPETPICVAVTIPQYIACIGLGADPTFVFLNVEPFDGEYYTTAGDATATGSVYFYGCGDYTPFERSSFIPFEEALSALLEFAEHRRRSEKVRWKDWDGRPA